MMDVVFAQARTCRNVWSCYSTESVTKSTQVDGTNNL